MPNYHGSSNYGLKWLESIADGKYYDLEVPDIEKGVDRLIDKGLVDKDKLGVIGWSNGAILAIELTVRTTRYKAAAAGAGDVDWISDWGNCEFGEAFDHFYFGKTPLEDPQIYMKKSPFYRLDKCRTPTLIFFGTDDRTVPTQQGWMHYRALQQLGKTDVRFVLFPGEKHSPTKLVHQKRKLQEELDWFDKHLFKTAKPANDALKDDSPLAHALKRKSASRSKGLFGSLVEDKLVPEVVAHGELFVGRFEVTRAQFRAFDAAYVVEPGMENYPANGISFEHAKAYCEWLSKLSKAKYRLPNEENADELYGEVEDGANTLDHWAGYKVNPDDARGLREKIESLGKTSLLKEVGQFKAAGEEGVFDLGGNVAEWTTTKEGKGKLMGGSADQPADAKYRESKAAAEYRGFRVVKE
jgi:dienelactone hydrolase